MSAFPATPDGTTSFAQLAEARAAVRMLDGVAPALSDIDALIERVPRDGSYLAAARAWRAAWVELSKLRVRINAYRNAAAAWMRSSPAHEAERVAEIEADLARTLTELHARWTMTAEALDAAGRLVSELRDLAVPADIRVAVRMIRSTSVPVPVTAPSPDDEAPSTRQEVNSATQVARVAAAATAAIPAPLQPAHRRPPAEAPASVRSTPRTLPTAPDTRSQPAAARRGRTWRHVLLAGSLAAGLVVGGAALVAAFDLLSSGRDAGQDSRGITASPSGSDDVQQSSLTPQSSPTVALTFDLHPVGPFDPAELPTVDAIGAVEIVPFPTAFDRSLRLTAPGARICFAVPGDATLSRISFDLQLEQGRPSARLDLRNDGATGIALALELDALDLAHGDWYRLAIDHDIHGDVDRPLMSIEDRPAIRIPTTVGAEPLPGESAACLELTGRAPGDSLLIDDVRLGR
jgi:hypothetical protein